MDKQKLFSRAWRHFTTEGHDPAVAINNHKRAICLYHLPDQPGCGCAIGIQLTPAQAATLPFASIEMIMNDHTFRPAREDLRMWLAIDGWADEQFLDRLQTCHDAAAVVAGATVTLEEFRVSFTKYMTSLAARYALAIPAAGA